MESEYEKRKLEEERSKAANDIGISIVISSFYASSFIFALLEADPLLTTK